MSRRKFDYTQYETPHLAHVTKKQRLTESPEQKCDLWDKLLNFIQIGDFEGLQKHMTVDMFARLDKMDRSLLFHAVEANQLDMVKFLYQCCSLYVNKPSRGYQTPLCVAVTGNFEEIVEFLLDVGCSLEHRDLLKRTPLHIAVVCGHLNIVQLLLERGAEAFSRDKLGHLIISSASTPEMLDLLL